MKNFKILLMEQNNWQRCKAVRPLRPMFDLWFNRYSMNQDHSSIPMGKPKRSVADLASSQPERAFTLTELVVVLAVIAVLGLLILPAVAATHDRSNRAVCQYHLRQIAIAMTAYAADNNDTLVTALNPAGPSGGGLIPITLDTSVAAANQIGLSTNLSANNFWTCPNRPGLPLLEYSQFYTIGYQYFGGITNWTLIGPARSPVKMSQSKPYWTLAADALLKINGLWAGQVVATNNPFYFEYGNIPSHHTTDATNIPQGGNEVFCDGSVQWIDSEKMNVRISFDGALGSTTCYFYQNPVDFPPQPKPGLATP